MSIGSALTSQYTPAVVSAATSGANILIAGIPNQTIRVFRMMFTLAAGTITFKSASTSLSGAMTCTALILESMDGNPLYVTAAGDDFVATLSGANQLSGTIWYTQS